jgi:hypothetical protein
MENLSSTAKSSLGFRGVIRIAREILAIRYLGIKLEMEISKR